MTNKYKMTALQLCPFSGYLENELNHRFDLVRWFEFDEVEQQAWLATNASAVRVVVTGGHLGCSNGLMDALPELAVVAINGAGFDKVDLAHAGELGVRITTTPDVVTDDVADLAMGLIIGLLREFPRADSYVRAGHWLKGDMPLTRKVSGRRFGIVGLGRIGSAIAERLQPFGEVCYTARRKKDVDYIFYEDLRTLAQDTSVLILATALNDSTHHLVDDGVLDALGPSGYLVNVGRGPLVDEAALSAALNEDRIAGAALDVFEDEPKVPSTLAESDKVLLTPHIATATLETRREMADLMLANLDAFATSKPLPTELV